METLNRTMSSQTEKLIKGLEHLVEAKCLIYDSLTETYGEEAGEELFTKSYEHNLESVLTTLKMDIGHMMEMNMNDLSRKVF